MKTKKNINYRKKNRKNKKNYSLRKKNTKYGGNKTYKNKNIVRPNFNVILNNGVPREIGTSMTNQCLWISIVDFLNREGIVDFETEEQITVSGIRRLLSQQNFDINNENDMADTEELYFPLLYLSQLYNLRFEFFDVSNKEGVYRTENGDMINNNYFVIVDSSVEHNDELNIVPIAFYGHHFQLITSGTDSNNNQVRYGNGNQTLLESDEQNTKLKPEKLFLNKNIEFIENENEEYLEMLKNEKHNKTRENIIDKIQKNYELLDEEIEKERELEMNKKLEEKISLEDEKKELLKKINNFENKYSLNDEEDELLLKLINENEEILKKIENLEIEIPRILNKLDEKKKYGGKKQKSNKHTKKRNIHK